MPSAIEIFHLLENAIKVWGIVIIPIGAFLENSVILSFIFPGVTVIFFSGFVIRTAGGNLPLMIVLASIGAFLGDNLDYFIGRKMGQILSGKPLFAKSIASVQPFIDKHGIWAIFAGRFSAWSRAWVALVSGISRYSYLKFAIVSLASAILWTSAWISGGYLLGGNRALIEKWFSRASLLVWFGLAGLVIYYWRTRIKLISDLIIFATRKYSRKLKRWHLEQ